jgi:hypothetical protein
MSFYECPIAYPVTDLGLHDVVNQRLPVLLELRYKGRHVLVRMCARAQREVVRPLDDVDPMGKIALPADCFLESRSRRTPAINLDAKLYESQSNRLRMLANQPGYSQMKTQFVKGHAFDHVNIVGRVQKPWKAAAVHIGN